MSESANETWLRDFLSDYEEGRSTYNNLLACADELQSLASRLDSLQKAHDYVNTIVVPSFNDELESARSRLDFLETYLSDHHGIDAADVIARYQAKDVERHGRVCSGVVSLPFVDRSAACALPAGHDGVCKAS